MNNNFNNNGNNMNNGFVYEPNQKDQFPMNQVLNTEMINALKQQSPKLNFFTPMTQVQKYGFMCTHKNPNGSSALTVDSNGKYHCNICGATFNLLPPGTDVSEVISQMNDIFNTMKFYKGNIDGKTAEVVYPAFYAAINQLPAMLADAYHYVDIITDRMRNNQPRYYRNGFNSAELYRDVVSGNMYNGGNMGMGGYGSPYQQNFAMGNPQYQQQPPMGQQNFQQQPQQYPQGYSPNGMMGQQPPMGQQGNGYTPAGIPNYVGGNTEFSNPIGNPAPATPTATTNVAPAGSNNNSGMTDPQQVSVSIQNK